MAQFARLKLMKMMDWAAIIRFLGGTTGISLAFAYVGRRVVDAFFASKVEEYKANLEKIATEHSIRFQRLHSERAEVIKRLYKHLVHLDNCLHTTLAFFQRAGDQPLEQKVEELGKAYDQLLAYYQPNRIFFDAETCALLDELTDGARGVFFGITALPIDPKHPAYKYDPDVLQERHKFWERARSTYKGNIEQLLRRLENKFRELLGIDI